jgi:PAS domain S-box-containing protein
MREKDNNRPLPQTPEDALRAIIASLSDIIFLFDADYRYLDCWTNHPEDLFVGPERFLGRTMAEVLGRDFAGPFERMVDEVLETGVPQELEYPSPDKAQWFLARVHRVPPAESAPARASMFISNITREHAAAEALRQSEQRFARTFEFAAAGIGLLSPEGRFLKANRAMCALLGYTEAELLEKTFQDITHPEDLSADATRVEQVLRGEIQTYQVRKRYLHKDGHTVWGLLYLSLVLNDAGEPSHFVAQILDITPAKRTEDLLNFLARQSWTDLSAEFSPALVRFLGESLEVDYVMLDRLVDAETAETVALYAHGKITPNMRYRLQGTPCQNVLHGGLCIYERGVQELFPADALLADMKAQSYVGIPLVGSSGAPVGLIAALHTKPIDGAAVRTVIELAASRAAAELERASALDALRRSEASLRQSQRVARIGHWVWDTRTNRVTWSEEMARIMGLGPGVPDVDLAELIATRVRPEDQPRIAAINAAIIRGEKPAAVEYGIHLPDGSQRTLMAVPGEAEFDEAGKMVQLTGIVQDITERTRMEEALRRAQKMEAIGQLTGGIAHDFNNLLGIMLGNLELLEQESLPERVHHRLAALRKAAQRGSDLTRNLLAFSRSRPAQAEITNVADRIRSMQNLIARSVTPRIELEYQFPDEPALARIDPGDLEDSLLNLVLNARDALPGGGRITIEVAFAEFGATAAEAAGFAAGPYVSISVTDTGTGMEPEILEHVFEPFFTTKAPGAGTGLGLSMAFGFAKRSGGHLTADSRPAHGSTFRLFLPRVNAGPAGPQQENSSETPRGKEVILVVDDEAALLDVVCSTLESLGYKAVGALNANEALAKLAQHPEISLVFTDVVMPGGLNGYELAEQIRLRYPALHILLTSGFSRAQASQEPSNLRVLKKPYTRAELAVCIRQALDAEPASAPRQAERFTSA